MPETITLSKIYSHTHSPVKQLRLLYNYCHFYDTCSSHLLLIKFGITNNPSKLVIDGTGLARQPNGLYYFSLAKSKTNSSVFVFLFRMSILQKCSGCWQKVCLMTNMRVMMEHLAMRSPEFLMLSRSAIDIAIDST